LVSVSISLNMPAKPPKATSEGAALDGEIFATGPRSISSAAALMTSDEFASLLVISRTNARMTFGWDSRR